ncbi:hypothetical protein ACFQHV_10535 [Promicromonospora thailandica]|uniref:Uncharacterized protein n=1 Tax=Promicromonospora thailandica TaxID=765201 RepID=A0A9X2G3Z1_9MICO|nr:hypothetical protein [Promicromonospora thailandica]MCP2264912.1 hypothetical protein [Promicromonospora thailandica]BFF18817.1 hypothetical protein GCM10025730_23380 [Promicromonospora thailandica]
MTTLVTPAVPGPGGEQDERPAPSLPPGMLPGTIPPSPPPQAARAGWWRRNVVWLVLLPVAVVVAAGASSFRVWAFWWPTGLHHEVDRVTQGGVAHYAGEYYDLGLSLPERANTDVLREVDMTVTNVEQVATLPAPQFGDPVEVPDGSVAYQVQLQLAAEPQTDLSGCQIVLVADDGTRYGEDTSDLLLGSVYRCLPPDAEDSLSVQPSWDVTSYVLVDADATITQVWLAFGGPEYVRTDLPPR